MKRILVGLFALLALAALTGWPLGIWGQSSDTKATKAFDTPMTMIGTVGTDGKTFVDDEEKKNWSVINPETLKRHESLHVTVSANVNTDRNEIHIMSVKLMDADKLKSDTVRRSEQRSIVRLDPALDEIVSPDTKLERLAGNLGHLEGPVWIRKGGYLIFSDMDAKVINKWDPKDGKLSIYSSGISEPDSNGITMDPQGRIVYCARGARQVVRLEKDGRSTILAGPFEGNPLNSPNDLVYKSDGSLYFTDPTYLWRPASDGEPPFNHVFLVKNGAIRLLNTQDLLHPNGLAFTPDEKHLYIVDSRIRKTIVRFDVRPDDTIDNGRLFIDMSSEKAPPSEGPDGIKVDQRGNVYAPGPGGLWIVSAEGKHLGTLSMPEIFANLAFGDPDGRSLYLAGHSTLFRLRVKVPGIHP